MLENIADLCIGCIPFSHRFWHNIYRPQRSFGKVMSVILSMGRCLPHCMLGYTPLARHPPSSACLDTHPLPSAFWDQPPPTLPSACWDTHGYCCRRYTSYWNAFLSHHENIQQWRIQDFSEVGAPTVPGVPTYDFAKFSQKLCEIERIWICRGRASLAPPLDPPLYSQFTYWLYS